MLLYHCNLGYPLLQEGCRVLLPTTRVAPRDAVAREHLERWSVMDPPKENEEEYVFIHDLAENDKGNTAAAVVNTEKRLGVMIEAQGTLHTLDPFRKEITRLKFTVLDGQNEIDAAAKKIDQIVKGRKKT